jgi:hypothetical protein
MIYAHANSRTLPTCNINLGWPNLPTPKVGNFAELLLLYPISVLARSGWKIIVDSLCDRMIRLVWVSCFSALRHVSVRSRGTYKTEITHVYGLSNHSFLLVKPRNVTTLFWLRQKAFARLQNDKKGYESRLLPMPRWDWLMQFPARVKLHQELNSW